VLLQDFDGSAVPKEMEEIRRLYAFIREHLLQPARLDHLWTMLAEDRHWEKVSKTETAVAKWFDFDEYQRQLALFHRKGQRKTLGKKYRNASG
jgi:hypothetical protein